MKHFYPASRAHHAYVMALDFGMKFTKGDGFWTPEGLLTVTGAGSYRIEIADESLGLLMPRVGDILRAEHPANLTTLWENFTPIFLEHIKKERYRNVRVIQRDGKPFHWPEQEKVAA